MKTVKDYRKRIRALRDAIKHLEGVALDSIAYVGAANYHERQMKAEADVRNAAEVALSK